MKKERSDAQRRETKRSKLSLKNTILIAGDISEKTTSEVAEKLLMCPTVNQVVINSDGGNDIDGFAIYDLLRLSGKKFKGIALGACQSAAILPFLACQERYCTLNTSFMCHYSSFEIDGAKEVRDVQGLVDEAKLHDQRYLRIISERTGIDFRLLKQTLDAGPWYFGAEEAKQYGFVKGII